MLTPGGKIAVAGSSGGTLMFFLGKSNDDTTSSRAIWFGLDERILGSPTGKSLIGAWNGAKPSHDGRRLLSADWGVVQLRRDETGWIELVPRVAGAPRTQRPAVWGPGNSLVNFARGDAPAVPESLLTVDPRSGQVAPAPVVPAQRVLPAKWVPRLGRLLYANTTGAGLLEVVTGAWQQLFAESGIKNPALSPDGRLIVYEATEGRTPGVYARTMPGPSLPTLVALRGDRGTACHR